MSITKRTLKTANPVTGRKVAYLVRVENPMPDPATGKRRWRTGQVGTHDEAKAVQAEWTTQFTQGTALEPTKATVSDVLDDWLRSKAGQITSNSYVDYEQAVRLHVKPALGTIRAQSLTAARIQRQYDEWREAGLSARMVRGCHMRLSQAFDQAERHGIVHRNPCRAVKPPTLERKTVETWNVEEVQAFLDAATNRPVLNRGGDTGRRAPDPLWPLWPLLALEGLRKGEALGLRWRDVDLERGTASIAQTVSADKAHAGRVIIQSRAKTAAGSRLVHLTPQTVDALRDHRKRQLSERLAAAEWEENDLIVCTGKGTPVNPGGNVNRSFDAILRATRLPDGVRPRRIRIHDLRHTAATLLLGAGVPAKIVSERLGHATIGITLDLYSHVTGDMQAGAALAMGALFDRKRAKVEA